MALLYIEHIGIAVNNLEEATRCYQKLLGVAPYKREEVPSEGVTTVFFKVGDNKIELLAANDEHSPVSQFLAKRGEGIHHIAYRTDDIRKEMQRLKEEGFRVLSDEPKEGAENMWVCFVHPKDAHGVLTELCQPKT
jgi:methylmalonyl-CoA/ethylmalonyl-CoA epimerase